MSEWEKYQVARLVFVLLSEYDFHRKVVRGAQAQDIHGKELEEKVATILVKGWRTGMQVDGTIKHV